MFITDYAPQTSYFCREVYLAMNRVLEAIIEEIDHKLECLQIKFGDDSWRKDIPSEAGWYIIKINTPIGVLKSIGPPQYEKPILIFQPASGLIPLDWFQKIFQSVKFDFIKSRQ